MASTCYGQYMLRATTPEVQRKLASLGLSPLARPFFSPLARCDSNTCSNAHVSGCVNDVTCMYSRQRMYLVLHSMQQWEFASANSSSEHRSELEQPSNFPAGGLGRAHLKVA